MSVAEKYYQYNILYNNIITGKSKLDKCCQNQFCFIHFFINSFILLQTPQIYRHTDIK